MTTTITAMPNSKKQQFEDLIDAMMIEEVAGLDTELKLQLQGLDVEDKRVGILSILDKDRKLFKKILKKLDNPTYFSKTEHIKDVVEMMREYVYVSEVEKKAFGEVMTPLTLVNEMLDTLPNEVWSNPNLKWLDPCGGCGIFSSVIIERLMINLDISEVDEERYKHIVENMLYVSELQPKNMFLHLVSFDPRDEYDLNVYCGSFLDEDFDNHCKDVWGIDKFDILVMNPPYNQMLDMAFMKKSYNISDSILCVHPSTWLLDEKGLQKKFSSTKELVKHDLISIELFNGNGVFGISLFVPCVIAYINKNIKHSSIKCVDRINNVEVYYKNIDDINKFSGQ